MDVSIDKVGTIRDCSTEAAVVDLVVSGSEHGKSKQPLLLAFTPRQGTTTTLLILLLLTELLLLVVLSANDDGVVERRAVEINCFARFRFSALDMDTAVFVILLLFVVPLDRVCFKAGRAAVGANCGVSFAALTGTLLWLSGGGMAERRVFELRTFPRGRTAVANEVRSMSSKGGVAERCDGTDEERAVEGRFVTSAK